MGIDASDIARLGPAAQRQILTQTAQHQQLPKESKYGNTKTEVNGITFDSKKEAERYKELMWLLKKGLIRDLRLQQEFVLQPAYTTPEGKRIRSIKYVADFTYEYYYRLRRTITGDPLQDPGHWTMIVEDVKSEATRKNRVYQMKKKMMMEKYGIEIREV